MLHQVAITKVNLRIQGSRSAKIKYVFHCERLLEFRKNAFLVSCFNNL